jgi:O-antigen ligase/Tfp pilus assembly protein PilF
MKQKPTKSSAKKPLNAKPAEPKLNLIYSLVLLGYAFITVLTPNMNTLDSLGPKFYTLAILNLVAYIIILIGNQLKPRQDFHWSFFRTWTGFIYTLFMLVSLLSFFKAFNIYESIINFSKLFTIFSAAYIVSIILRRDKRYLYVISISLALLLIFDSFTVFYHIVINFMEGKGQNISEIKSIYSNKNILSAAIFVKIAFVLWLFTFGKGWMKALGGFTLFIAFMATLFMSTRSFYVGTIFLILTYGPFMFIRYYRKNEKRKIIMLTIYLSAAIIIGFFLFTAALKYLYPSSSQNRYTVDFITRLKSLSAETGPVSSQGGLRAQAWKNSFKLIKANPLLGVGTGNWKVEVLKYETPTTGAYIYMYKNHNDFIETTADTGIFGGALFLGVFILIFANFIKAFFKAKKGEESSYTWLFLPAFGLFCYSFDAMFNFPSDRPEIISFFAIFVGAGIAFSASQQSAVGSQQSHRTQNLEPGTWNLERVTRHASHVTLIAIFLSLMIGSIYIFYLNFESLKLQRIAKQELNAGTLTSKSELFLNGFPAIPDINIEGEPIAVTKARYLITEEKYQQAIDLLKKDNSSPYDTRQQFFIAMAFFKLGQPDSALVYAHKVLKLKPFFSGNISVMSNAYEAKGNLTEAMKVLDDHIQLNNKNGQPVSDIIYKQQASLAPRARIQKFQETFNNGLASFGRKEYRNAIKYLSKFIDKETGVAQAFEYRAFCYFYLKKYQLSLTDIERAIAIDPSKPGYINLRGVNKHMLGNEPAACADFQTAINMGDKDAVNNYEKFCKKKN